MKGRVLRRWRLLALSAAAGLGCGSPVDPASVGLAGVWWTPSAYSGCSLTLDLAEDNSGGVSGLATSVCPSAGPASAPITGSRSGATLQLTFPGVLGAPEHAGRILDESSLRLGFSLPQGVQQVRFTRGVPEDTPR